MDKKLLFVDDDEAIHRVLNRIFGSGGYTLMSAFNGDEGVKMATQEIPQLILLDINMPKMDGYQVIRNLRRNKDTQKIPVLMLTANGEIVDEVVGFELGVEDYVAKPFNVDDLKKRVESLV